VRDATVSREGMIGFPEIAGTCSRSVKPCVVVCWRAIEVSDEAVRAQRDHAACHLPKGEAEVNVTVDPLERSALAPESVAGEAHSETLTAPTRRSRERVANRWYSLMVVWVLVPLNRGSPLGLHIRDRSSDLADRWRGRNGLIIIGRLEYSARRGGRPRHITKDRRGPGRGPSCALIGRSGGKRVDRSLHHVHLALSRRRARPACRQQNAQLRWSSTSRG